MRTTCGHDITVRCARCTGKEWDPIQPRRWVKLSKKFSKTLTEHNITAEEARTSVAWWLVENGLRLEQVRDYDPKKDEFEVLARDSEGKMVEAWVEGPGVAALVLSARLQARMPNGLKRPSDIGARSPLSPRIVAR